MNALVVERKNWLELREEPPANFSHPSEPAPEGAIPRDLRVWMDAPALARAARQCAQSTSATLHPVFSFDAKRLFHPWRMLALLSYAYATGEFSSRAIADLAERDEVYRDLCGPSRPTADLLRRFRNYNRFAVQRCLERLILLAWKARTRNSAAPAQNSVNPLLIIDILCEAQTRLQRAHDQDAGNQGPELTPMS